MKTAGKILDLDLTDRVTGKGKERNAAMADAAEGKRAKGILSSTVVYSSNSSESNDNVVAQTYTKMLPRAKRSPRVNILEG